MNKPVRGIFTQSVILIIALIFMSLGLFGCPKKAPPPIKVPEEKEEVPVKEKPKPPPPPAERIEKREVPRPVTPPPPPPVTEEPLRPKRVPDVEFIESRYQTVYFEFDKSRLTVEARQKLRRNAESIRKDLQEYPDLKLLIEGHCDDRGTNEYNLALGERRAFSARDYLISLGISANALYTKSWGEEKPVDPRRNEEAWAKNRRAEFHVYKGE